MHLPGVIERNKQVFGCGVIYCMRAATAQEGLHSWHMQLLQKQAKRAHGPVCNAVS